MLVGPLLTLAAAGLLAGAMNARAGGGSFVSLPALIAAGVPSVLANASSTVALWPGGAVSAWTYHRRLDPIGGIAPGWMLGVTVVGGLLGSVLLLWTPSSAFDVGLPWLLLVATLALAFGGRVGDAWGGRLRGQAGVVLPLQFSLGIYGGFFGGAVGLMMAASWLVLGERDLKRLNAPRTLLVTACNTVAVLTFVFAGAVRWPETLAMLAGGLLGGTLGARVGRVVPGNVTRVMTLVCAAAITAAFFVRAYGPALARSAGP
ncbi:MAG: sulfite exporter TauE/SafE family protein [Acetobacteraceae bacterium]